MAQWTRDDLEAALKTKGWLVGQREIEHAVQFELSESVKINLYNTGNITYSGPKSSFKTAVEEFVEAGPNVAEAEEAG